MPSHLTYLLTWVILFIVVLAGYNAFRSIEAEQVAPMDGTPYSVTLTGTYVCLPHVAGGPGTKECAFGLKTDDGTYYAVNFGASASAAEQFQNAQRITAEGFVVIKEALSSDQWAKYDMKGIFTITKMIDPVPRGTQNTSPGQPTFAWKYAQFEAADIPQTKISLVATYPDGTTRSKQIDTIEGACENYDSTDTDVYAKSKVIICYYAGFGCYYKVVDIGSGVFAVQRKEFEEASPDYNPPVANFETIAEF